jgi:hypothetical protein
MCDIANSMMAVLQAFTNLVGCFHGPLCVLHVFK